MRKKGTGLPACPWSKTNKLMPPVQGIEAKNATQYYAQWEEKVNSWDTNLLQGLCQDSGQALDTSNACIP